MPNASSTTELDLTAFRSPPERKPLGQQVYETLKQTIVKGDLSADSRIVESRLAEAMGISRTPVREAIHKLEREGLLRRSPKGGFFVAGLTRSDIEETFGIRSVLESYAARLAAVKHQEDELQALEDNLAAYQEALGQGRMDALLKINTEFHDLLYAMSRSPKLIRMINDLRDPIYRFRALILRVEINARTSHADHKRMLDLIRRRDAEGVERLARDHILRGQDMVLEVMDRAPEAETAAA
jgi:DNA-binding GntR family transcriptional regulator